MRNLFTKTRSAIALSFAGILTISLIGCKKEAAMISPNQSQVKSSTVQSNAAINDISNEKLLIDLFVTIPCANGGVGEDVLLTGYLHVVDKITINGTRFHVKQHVQPQGISGIGQTTGDKYQATGVTQDEFGGSFVNGQFEETFVNNFRIIGQGKGNNYLVHEVFHVTVNANGIVTTILDHARVDCK